MKLFALIFCVVITTDLWAQGVTKNGKSTTTSTSFVNENGKTGNAAALTKYGRRFCPTTLTITHTIGTVAPATTTITYGVVTTSLSGASKCWITRNLGATAQATQATTATAAAAGWYWQFNRKQGYAAGPTPAWTITAINENSDWLAANDPCALQLGAGWRIPTQTEWTTADAGWTKYNNTYASVLKLHAAGYLRNNNGAVTNRGSQGDYWSSTQNGNTNGWGLGFSNNSSAVNSLTKPYGFTVRCLRD